MPLPLPPSPGRRCLRSSPRRPSLCKCPYRLRASNSLPVSSRAGVPVTSGLTRPPRVYGVSQIYTHFPSTAGRLVGAPSRDASFSEQCCSCCSFSLQFLRSLRMRAARVEPSFPNFPVSGSRLIAWSGARFAGCFRERIERLKQEFPLAVTRTAKRML